MKWVNSSEVSFWLALRAGVLRRAVSPSSTAQERRAEVRASAISQSNVALPVNGKQAWQEVSAQLNHRSHRNDLRQTPKKSTCAVPPLQAQWLMATRTLLSPPPVLPNWALNRTHCGGPAFGL